MLGVCLLFVGIVLINNGLCSIKNVDSKSAAVMNFFTGGLSLFINLLSIIQGNYYADASWKMVIQDYYLLLDKILT